MVCANVSKVQCLLSITRQLVSDVGFPVCSNLAQPGRKNAVTMARKTKDIRVIRSHTQTNSVALSPQANYTDWATATCRRNLVLNFVDRRVSRGERGGSPTVVNLSFIDRSRYFSSKYLLIYPHKG
jgi:hypothetical protein